MYNSNIYFAQVYLHLFFSVHLESHLSILQYVSMNFVKIPLSSGRQQDPVLEETTFSFIVSRNASLVVFTKGQRLGIANTGA